MCQYWFSGNWTGWTIQIVGHASTECLVTVYQQRSAIVLIIKNSKSSEIPGACRPVQMQIRVLPLYQSGKKNAPENWRQ
jgi:hypothetical protein